MNRDWMEERLAVVSGLQWLPFQRWIRYIVIHHSATKDGIVPDWEAIKRYHTSYKFENRAISEDLARELTRQGKRLDPPWSDIGYHAGIENIEGKYIVRLGRPLDTFGSHARDGDFNSRSLGICVVGNFDGENPPAEQWWTAAAVVHYLRRFCRVPIEFVIGHREAQEVAGVQPKGRKSCPGKAFDMHKFRMDLHKIATDWRVA